jgi:hypothetical protein
MAFLRIGDEVPKKGRGSKLTRLQMQFIEAMTDPNGIGYHSPTNAVRLTDYKTDNPNKMGMQLMQHPLVAAEIKSRNESRRERLELTADYVIHKLLSLVEDTEKDNDRIRALELLGKTLSLFKERQEISGPDGEAIKYEQKVNEDAADFARRMAGLAKRAGATGVSEVPKQGSAG